MRPIQIIVFCLYMCSLNLYAQVSVTGTVNDNTGESLPGVSILAKDGDRTFGSTTDINGRYEIKVNQGATLEFSFIGFAKQKVKVGTNKIINITLEPENEMLDEVVVIGYGSVKKKRPTRFHFYGKRRRFGRTCFGQCGGSHARTYFRRKDYK